MFQLRHKELGLFQGTALGFAFWYSGDPFNIYEMPEQGILRIGSLKDLQFVADLLCRDYTGVSEDDLIVELFDEEKHQEMLLM